MWVAGIGDGGAVRWPALLAARAVPGVGQTALFCLESYKVSINGKLGGRAEKLMARPKSQPSQLEGAARAARTV